MVLASVLFKCKVCACDTFGPRNNVTVCMCRVCTQILSVSNILHIFPMLYTHSMLTTFLAAIAAIYVVMSVCRLVGWLVGVNEFQRVLNALMFKSVCIEYVTGHYTI